MKKLLKISGLLTLTMLLASLTAFSEEEKATPAKKKSKTIIVKRLPPEKKMTYKLIPLSTISFETVNSVCKKWLSKDGLMTYEKNRNSILVYDTPETIKKIRNFIGDVDKKAVNIRIEVDFIGHGSNRDDGITVRTDPGTKNENKLVFVNGKWVKPKRIEIDPKMRRDTSSKLNSQIIVAQSGMPATLWVGHEELDPSWLRQVRLNPDVYIITENGVVQIPGTDIDFKWAKVGSSLKVLATAQDNGLIKVEIYPEISYMERDGRHRNLKVESLTTTLLVKSGQRINIGGAISKNSQAITNLFGPNFYSNKSGQNVLNMYLKATAMSPGDKRNSRPPSYIPRTR